ncbi:MAG TPA: GMC family oxidoreductase [bacterium]|jgi:choline dehydrogenase-like flavoprotein|nr:GMC family oxidoreductase [bacterium]
MARDYDVIIIGSGAGGGTLARKLAPSGKRVLILERGGFLPREKDNWSTAAVFTRNKYKAPEAWTDKNGQSFHPGIHYYVGGNTKVFGAALLRFRKEDFGALRHAGGLSPAWPISYEDLEPWYGEAETLYEVHGLFGMDPTEPYSSRPYAHPPISHEPRVQRLFDDLKALGHRPFHLPVGVRLNEADPANSACIRCNTCDGFPCLVHAKSDAEVMAVRPALEFPNVELLTQAKVLSLETDAGGREVRAVHAMVNGEPQVFRAGIVVLAAGAVNSAALLLRSAGDRHPRGLANSSDQVGRNYMCHNNSAMLALSREPNPTVFQKTLGVNDFYFGDGAWKFPMGHIQMLGKSDAEMLKEDAPGFAPGMALDMMAKHAVDFWMTSEDLPDPENRVSLDAQGGIRLAYTENNLEAHHRLMQKLKGMLEAIGCGEHLIPNSVYLGKKIGIAGTAHQSGTLRMGADPATSVVDPWCKAHDLDNLYIADSGFFVSSTAVNPALTIMANALRLGAHLLERLG